MHGVGVCQYNNNKLINHVTEMIERAERIKDDYEKNDSCELHLSVNQ